MDVPNQAILELRGICQDLIPDVPDWVNEDAEPEDSNVSTEAADTETLLVARDFEEPNAKKP